MRHPVKSSLAVWLGAILQLLAMAPAGCTHESLGTSVKVALTYDDTLGLDTVDVMLADALESSPIAHNLVLLVPDDLAGAEMPLAVWGGKAGARVTYGTASVTPELGSTVSASLSLADCAGEPLCITPRPSNGVDPGSAAALRGTTRIAMNTIFDVDTGAITGGVTRPAGVGDDGSIGYAQAPPFASGGAPLGIFLFRNLTVEAGATVRFTGTRAAVVLIGGVGIIAGTIDIAAGHDARSSAGPGGGSGGTSSAAARGCGAGRPGVRGTIPEDSGGGGAGAGTAGGNGGLGGITSGGPAGPACMPMSLEPLQGGSGGGRGSPGASTLTTSGGGGGGALQITALLRLAISGTIHAGGAGGDGGAANPSDGGSAAGGGSGGAILLEAPIVIVDRTAIVAANGGGGGSGGGAVAGNPGTSANASQTPAPGGAAADVGLSTGGSGGALRASPMIGGASTNNGGGGGGAAGVIVIRGRARMITGVVSPAALEEDVRL